MPTRSSSQTAATWADAPDVIGRLLAPIVGEHGRAIVGVTGAVGSGKSRLAERVASDPARPGVIVPTDAYLPDYEVVAFEERDLPEHAHLDELAAHLADLREGRPADIPVWSFDVHRRTGSSRVEPAAVVVVEGLFALHASVRDHLDVAVFVEAPREHRLERMLARERAGERGWSVEHAAEHFAEVAEPIFERHAGAYRAAAHVVVDNPGMPEGDHA